MWPKLKTIEHLDCNLGIIRSHFVPNGSGVFCLAEGENKKVHLICPLGDPPDDKLIRDRHEVIERVRWLLDHSEHVSSAQRQENWSGAIRGKDLVYGFAGLDEQQWNETLMLMTALDDDQIGVGWVAAMAHISKNETWKQFSKLVATSGKV